MNNTSRICCCNLRAAGIIVAFVEFLLVVLAVYGLIYNYYIFGSSYALWFIVGIISVIIILIAIVLLLYAIKKESARLLFPHLSAQVTLLFPVGPSGRASSALVLGGRDYRILYSKGPINFLGTDLSCPFPLKQTPPFFSAKEPPEDTSASSPSHLAFFLQIGDVLEAADRCPIRSIPRPRRRSRNLPSFALERRGGGPMGCCFCPMWFRNVERKEEKRLSVCQVFLILFLLIVALVVGLLLLFGAYKGIRRLLGHGGYDMTDDATITLGYTIIAVYLFIAILEIFFFIIIYKLYKYFKEYKLIPNKDPFLIEVGKDAEVYTAQWQSPSPKSNYMYRGSPDAGDIYPYGPQ
ncbi:hypothetical protein QR680_009086 [Steinernema hermaphroditum]|uniref:Uncharacterized protein n=1 Tax=Steinernema hermaphroditum TaxID=289476 RepID=A0AA39M989_9BILA|nr:hypothetical protein QR680_009086 [Steinernema hermaphroditum]